MSVRQFGARRSQRGRAIDLKHVLLLRDVRRRMI
jgi:hypothetical protein